jgi:hypothetical protein
MKRLLFLMIGVLFLFSCSEDEKPANNFIEGTKWQASKSGSEYTANNEIDFNYSETCWLDFTNTTFTLTIKTSYDRNIDSVPEEEELSTVKGTYKFEYPETTLRPTDGKDIRIKIGTYQLETIPESGESSRIFTKIQE